MWKLQKKDRRFIAYLLLQATILLLLILFTLGARSWRRKRRLTVLIPSPEEEEWNAFVNGIRQGAEEENLSVILNGSEAGDEGDLVMQSVEDGSDAVILQPGRIRDEEKVLRSASSGTPLTLAVYPCRDGSGYFREILPDRYGMGKALADEIIKDYGGSLSGHSVGILDSAEDAGLEEGCEAGLLGRIRQASAEISWTIHPADASSLEEALSEAPPADIIVGLDTRSLVAAGSKETTNSFNGTVIYGIGASAASIHDLDVGAVQKILVPDDFLLGYKCALSASDQIHHRLWRRADRVELGYEILSREDIFTERGEEILYSVVQR